MSNVKPYHVFKQIGESASEIAEQCGNFCDAMDKEQAEQYVNDNPWPEERVGLEIGALNQRSRDENDPADASGERDKDELLSWGQRIRAELNKDLPDKDFVCKLADRHDELSANGLSAGIAGYAAGRLFYEACNGDDCDHIVRDCRAWLEQLADRVDELESDQDVPFSGPVEEPVGVVIETEIIEKRVPWAEAIRLRLTRTDNPVEDLGRQLGERFDALSGDSFMPTAVAAATIANALCKARKEHAASFNDYADWLEALAGKVDELEILF